MSHIVEIRTQVHDAAGVQAACRRLGIAPPTHETVKLFGGEATGIAVRLDGWRYPVVADLESGQLRFDNYNGAWGEPAKLDQFLQLYAVEKAKIEARKTGQTVVETPLGDGSIKLTIQVGGDA